MPKPKETPHVSSIGQYAKEQGAKRFPDGSFWEQPKLTWYRVIDDNGAVRWCFSGNCEQQEFYAQVEDTGKSFRWSVGFDDPADEGYTRTLSLAKLKAEKLWHELTDLVAEDLAKEQAQINAWLASGRLSKEGVLKPLKIQIVSFSGKAVPHDGTMYCTPDFPAEIAVILSESEL